VKFTQSFTELGLLIFVKRFHIYVLQEHWHVVSFYCVGCFCLWWGKYCTLIKGLWKYFHPLQSLEEFVKNCYFLMVSKTLCQIKYVLDFLQWETFPYWFTFLDCYYYVLFSISSWINLDGLHVSRNFSIFCKLSRLFYNFFITSYEHSNILWSFKYEYNNTQYFLSK
jgi:hypothetical protein